MTTASLHVLRVAVATAVFASFNTCAPSVGQGAAFPITGTSPATKPLFTPSAQALTTNSAILNTLNTTCSTLQTIYAQLGRTSRLQGFFTGANPSFSQLVSQTLTVLNTLVTTLAMIAPRNPTDAAQLVVYQTIAENSLIQVTRVQQEL